MLTAVNAAHHRVVASGEARATGAFCPVCGRQLQVRIPVVRVAHFAHPPRSGCDGGHALRAQRAAAKRAAATHRKELAEQIAGQLTLFDL